MCYGDIMNHYLFTSAQIVIVSLCFCFLCSIPITSSHSFMLTRLLILIKLTILQHNTSDEVLRNFISEQNATWEMTHDLPLRPETVLVTVFEKLEAKPSIIFQI